MRRIVRRVADAQRRYFAGRAAYKFVLRDWRALTDLKLLGRVLSTARFTRNLQAQLLEVPLASRIVVIAPHPDDELLGPGGTLIKALARGAQVRVVYLTDGKGGEILDEIAAVARRIGYESTFLRLPLGNIPLSQDATTALRDAVNGFAPDALFLPFLADDHDDHRRASELLMRAYAGGAPSQRPEVWGYQVYTMLPPNVVVDITEVADEKAQCVRLLASQSSRDWAHYALGMNAHNSRFIPTGGRPRYIEAFFVVPFDEYLDLCRHYFVGPDAYYSEAYQH